MLEPFRNQDEISQLLFAVQLGDPSLEKFLSAGSDLNIIIDGKSLLAHALHSYQIPTYIKLLDHCNSSVLLAKDNEQHSLLWQAVKADGGLAIELIKRVNKKYKHSLVSWLKEPDIYGKTLAHWAAQEHQFVVIAEACKHIGGETRIFLNRQDLNGNTPLHEAYSKTEENKDNVRDTLAFLINNKADLLLENDDGVSPIALHAKLNIELQKQIFEKLKPAGKKALLRAYIALMDTDSSPLIRSNYQQLLLSKGPDSSFFKGKPPLDDFLPYHQLYLDRKFLLDLQHNLTWSKLPMSKMASLKKHAIIGGPLAIGSASIGGGLILLNEAANAEIDSREAEIIQYIPFNTSPSPDDFMFMEYFYVCLAALLLTTGIFSAFMFYYKGSNYIRDVLESASKLNDNALASLLCLRDKLLSSEASALIGPELVQDTLKNIKLLQKPLPEDKCIKAVTLLKEQLNDIRDKITLIEMPLGLEQAAPKHVATVIEDVKSYKAL